MRGLEYMASEKLNANPGKDLNKSSNNRGSLADDDDVVSVRNIRRVG